MPITNQELKREKSRRPGYCKSNAKFWNFFPNNLADAFTVGEIAKAIEADEEIETFSKSVEHLSANSD